MADKLSLRKFTHAQNCVIGYTVESISHVHVSVMSLDKLDPRLFSMW